MNAQQTAEIADVVADYEHDPLGYVLAAFPWKVAGTVLADEPGPRPWQREVLEEIGQLLKAGASVQEAIQIAVASGHGIGKSALVSWLIMWAMSTRENTRGVVTANTDTQLRTKTWPEVKKWHGLALNGHWFVCESTSLHARGASDKTWRVDAIPWSEHNTEAFAGLHNKGNRLLVIFDEASAVADKIWEVTEGAMTDENTELIWCVFGNPTRNTGRFRECFGKRRHRWKCRQVDSRTVPGTNKAQLDKWVEDYGEDSDFVRVRVRGVFPASSPTQFISSDLVERARKRDVPTHATDAVILGVDVAREGDDESVICCRVGLDARSFGMKVLRVADTMDLVGHITRFASDLRARGLNIAHIAVDAHAMGAGVVDRLRQLGWPVMAAYNWPDNSDPEFHNPNDRWWSAVREWLKVGAIPDDEVLADQLTGREMGFDARNRLSLEKKSHMKERGLGSPDRADALCFVARTMILTPSGERPIESIRVGDEVVTPLRIAKVVKLWESACDRLTAVDFSHGRSLVGKGEHKVFTWESGFVRLDALALTFTMETSSLARVLLWRLRRWWSTAAGSIEFKPRVDTISRTTPLTRNGFFTVACGSTPTAPSRTDSRFTIATEIGRIIALRIWNLLKRRNTIGSTCWPAARPPKAERQRCGRWRRLGLRLPNGIGPRLAVSGTVSTGSGHGLTASLPRPNVLRAGACSTRCSRVAPGSVLDHASSVAATNGKRRLLRSAFNAISRFWRTSTAMWSVVPSSARTDSRRNASAGIPSTPAAPSATRSFWSRLSIRTRRVVPVDVQTASEPHAPVKVYNLTLDHDNAYYANGILVANCLTFAFPVAPGTMGAASAPQSRCTGAIEYDPFAER